MADDPQQPGQPPAGAPGSWPPAAPDPNAYPQQPGYGAPPAGGPTPWGQPQQPQQPAWGQPQQPGFGAPPPGGPTPWGQPQQPGFGAPPPGGPTPWGQPPAPGGYPPPQPGFMPPAPGGYPPPPYGAPGGYPPPGYGFPPRYAGFWIRLVAYIVDSILYGVVVFVAFLTVFVLVGFLLLPVVALGWFPLFWWKRGATPGMQLLGLRIVRAVDGGPIDGGMAAIRFIVYFAELILASFCIIGLLGFVWAAFEPRKRAVHDMAAGTVVIHTN